MSFNGLVDYSLYKQLLSKFLENTYIFSNCSDFKTMTFKAKRAKY